MGKVWIPTILLLVFACQGNENTFKLEGAWYGPCQLHQTNGDGAEVTYSRESLTFLSDNSCEDPEAIAGCGQASIEHAFYTDEVCAKIATRLSPVISRYRLGERFVNAKGVEIIHFEFANGKEQENLNQRLKTFIHGAGNRLYFAQGENLQEVMEFSYYLERQAD